MNRTKLKNYAPQARREFIAAVTDRAALHGLSVDGDELKVVPVTMKGDLAIIGGTPFPVSVAEKRKRLEERLQQLAAAGKKPADAFHQIMEAMAYTWFNRLVAIRYMEIHGYLPHPFRVLSHPDPSKSIPEIVEQAEHVDLPGLDPDAVVSLKLDGNKDSDLYRMLLLAQCNALHTAMPFLFERIDDETELLLPDNLLHSDSIIRKLVNEIDEADWQQVEIIGWLYQFYISEKKDEVIGKVVKSEDIPAATQLFTPNWIVKYLVQNSLGRQWLATYPQSPLKAKMEFYIEPAEQTPEVQAELKKITPESLNPEELTLMDPACGSGHILVEAYDLLKEIYLERGYRLRDIPNLILTKNLFGLEIDDRAAQLAAFALIMKARADDRRIFDGEVQPNVLAIQESNGLNVDAIVQAFTEKKITSEDDIAAGEFGFMGAVRAPLFATENRVAATVDEKVAADLKAVFSVFQDAKTYGSLIRVPPVLGNRLPHLHDSLEQVANVTGLLLPAVRIAKAFIRQASFLTRRYDVVCANPPYMNGSGMNPVLKAFVAEHYAVGKADLFSAFILQGFHLARQWGGVSMVTMQAWMFLKTFEALRQSILSDKAIVSLAHLGPRAFGSISGEVVSVAAFSCISQCLPNLVPVFLRLTEGDEELKRKGFSLPQYRHQQMSQSDFGLIPGSPVSYWASDAVRSLFISSPPLGDVASPKQGMATTKDQLFIRYWHEVDHANIGFNVCSEDDSATTGRKWFPFNKGGGFRKWFGNNGLVVNYMNKGQEVCDFIDNTPGARVGSNGRVINRRYYFRPGITWGLIGGQTPSFREFGYGFIISHKGPGVFADDRIMRLKLLGYLNSRVASHLLQIISPSQGCEVGHLCRLPIPAIPDTAATAVESLVAVHTCDWNSIETAWDFAGCALVGTKKETVEDALASAVAQSSERTDCARRLERANHALMIGMCGLDRELSPEVSANEITLDRADRPEHVRRALSYMVGCAMGRYSPDKPGLIYANSGNEGFDLSEYKTFPADKDGIIPLTEFDWFPDDAAHRFEEFVAVAWPKEHLEENLKFVADSLGTKNGEQPRDTIRRYFADDFYKHHLQTYKRRPIYWLFTSGKLGAFQCLVYLHRYHEGTLARMRTEYVIPLQGKINARIEQLEGDKAKATSTAHRRKLEKEQELLRKQQTELQKFDEKLRHYADQRIKLDLDNGVKVNYGKFGDLLACVTQVCGKGEDDE